MENKTSAEIQVDVNAIPEYARRRLAEGAIALTKEQMNDPSFESRFREWKEKRETGQTAG